MNNIVSIFDVLSLQEISDRLEIHEILARYSDALDRRDWDAIRRVFTPDALIDYTEMGGVRGGINEVIDFLQSAMGIFSGYQHLISNVIMDIDGDTASVRSICHNPMLLSPQAGKSSVMVCGLWYRDRLVRSHNGWLILERYEEKCYMGEFRAIDFGTAGTAGTAGGNGQP